LCIGHYIDVGEDAIIAVRKKSTSKNGGNNHMDKKPVTQNPLAK